MRTIAFYSYKGGVGRTLAAANFAMYLAKLGQRTVVIDFDLEAPGLDSKFPNFELPQGQRGLLDYILEFQGTERDPDRVQSVALDVSVQSVTGSAPLWLIPAGDYMSPDYSMKLGKLDWRVFSQGGNGVAFFQRLLARISQEFQAEFVVIDSRTGISEIGGLCTQQLADEVVMLSSLSAESIKMTRRIGELIRGSEIAKALGKSIDVKVVVTRVPEPRDLEELKEKCVTWFGVEEKKLFFLFSRQTLEREEFLAISEPSRDGDLVDDYVRLFYGLDIELAGRNIQAEIQRTLTNILSASPEDASRSIVELATLYPHPDVYRTAMRFFRLIEDSEKVKTYAWKLLDLVSDDQEAWQLLGRSYLAQYVRSGSLRDEEEVGALRSLDVLWRRKELKPEEAVTYAAVLEEAGDMQKSHEIAAEYIDDGQLEDEYRARARLVAARTALELGLGDVAKTLVGRIPRERLRGALAALAIEQVNESSGASEAFDLAKSLLRRDVSPQVLEQAVQLATKLSRMEEVGELLRTSESYYALRRNPRLAQYLRRVGLSVAPRGS